MHEPRQRVLADTADAFSGHYGYGWFLELDAEGNTRTSSHGGASGAMLWIDWDLDVIGVFLAPGTHISELLPAIRQSQARVRNWFE